MIACIWTVTIYTDIHTYRERDKYIERERQKQKPLSYKKIENERKGNLTKGNNIRITPKVIFPFKIKYIS